MAAATNDEEMEKLASLADQICDEFEAGISEIQTLKSTLNAEIKQRQSLELTCSSLTRENERLKNLHLETLNKLMLQLQQRGNSHNLREELQKVSRESMRQVEDHRNEVESLKRSHEEKVRAMEGRIRGILNEKAGYEATICELNRELTALRKKLKDVEEKSRVEIDDLRDCLFAAQEECKELSNKLRDLEKDLLVSKTKMYDQRCSSSSDKMVDALKHKIIKLRRDNRRLNNLSLASKDT